MTSHDSTGSGLASVIFGSAVNNDDYVIKAGHHVTFDWDNSGLANGVGWVVDVGAISDFKVDAVTYMKPKGNIDVNGAFYMANRATVSSFSATSGRTNVYEAARTLATYSVEESLGVPYLAAWNEVMEAAIEEENGKRLNEQLIEYFTGSEMMADEVISFIESMRSELTLSDYLDYVEANPGSYYHDSTNNLLYIHCSDSGNPSGKTITGIEPVHRPTAGTENRCTIMFNSTGVFTNTGGGTPVIQGYGWHPEREWAQLSANVALNATELSALTKSLDIQQGDKIVLGSGSEFGQTIEASKGVYTVSSYNAETKVITLTSGIQTARLKDDYIAIYSRPIKIARISGTTSIFGSTPTIFNNGVFVGVFMSIHLMASPTYAYNIRLATFTGWKLKHSTFLKYVANGTKNIEIKDVVLGGGAYYFFDSCENGVIQRGVVINATGMGYNSLNTLSSELIGQNIAYIGGNVENKNSIIRNVGVLSLNGYVTLLKNCIAHGRDAPLCGTVKIEAHDTTFQSDMNILPVDEGKLYNCVFDNITVDTVDNLNLKKNRILESFNHNGIENNYAAFGNGGTIETLFIGEDVQPGHLIFKPISSVYPVFRDIDLILPANKWVRLPVSVSKDFSGGTIKLELLDPSGDPLIDLNATVIKSSTFPDITDDTKTLAISIRSRENKQYKLRISVINSSGNVNIDINKIFKWISR